MMPRRSLLSLVPLLAVFGAAPVFAQGRVIDEGTFSIAKAGAPAHTESFRITRGETGLITANGQLSIGTEQVNSSLTTDTLGMPMQYKLTVTEARAKTFQVSASARGGRFAAAMSNKSGDESMKEYPLAAGGTVILDAGLFHQLYFVPLGHRTGSVQVIEPRASRTGTLALTASGLEPIDVGGHSVTATHYSLQDRGVRTDFWVDAAGRLLRASIPAQGVTASREELPK